VGEERIIVSGGTRRATIVSGSAREVFPESLCAGMEGGQAGQPLAHNILCGIGRIQPVFEI